MEIVKPAFGPQAPKDLSQKLRAIADAVDRGEIVDFVGAYIEGGNYCFLYGSSLQTELILSTLVHANCIQRFRA